VHEKHIVYNSLGVQCVHHHFSSVLPSRRKSEEWKFLLQARQMTATKTDQRNRDILKYFPLAQEPLTTLQAALTASQLPPSRSSDKSWFAGGLFRR
jgi:hypothetical protein